MHKSREAIDEQQRQMQKESPPSWIWWLALIGIILLIIALVK